MVTKSSLHQRALELPPWLAVGIVALASVGGSVIATIVLKYAQGQPIALFVPYMLVPAVVPVLVSVPIAAFVLGLMHRLEAVRREAERLSRTDLLTGALNRRRFIEIAQRELARARHTRAPMSVLLLDVDDFKRVNDRYGHDVGDAVLKRVSAVCEKTLRPGDPFARWGGEEFVALLLGAGAGDAIGVALRVRESIAAGSIAHDGAPIRVTVSIGVAGTDGIDGDLDLLITRADLAMYEAKRSGKNATAVAGPAAREGGAEVTGATHADPDARDSGLSTELRGRRAVHPAH